MCLVTATYLGGSWLFAPQQTGGKEGGREGHNRAHTALDVTAAVCYDRTSHCETDCLWLLLLLPLQDGFGGWKGVSGRLAAIYT